MSSTQKLKWTRKKRFNINKNKEVYEYYLDGNNIHCVLLNHEQDVDTYHVMNSHSAKITFGPKKIKISKFFNKQYIISDGALFCLSGDSRCQDLLKWDLQNVETDPVIVEPMLKCHDAIITTSPDSKIHIIGIENHYIFHKTEQIECIQTPFTSSAQGITRNNNDNKIILLDVDGLLWSFNIVKSKWCQLQFSPIPKINWCTKIVKSNDFDYVFIMSGGADCSAIYMNEDGCYLDDYHRNIEIISLKKQKQRQSKLLLPESVGPDNVSSIRSLITTKAIKKTLIRGYINEDIAVKKNKLHIPDYLQAIIVKYYINEILEIFARKCKYSINVDHLLI